MAADGSNQSNLTNDPADDWEDPTWSQNGAQIAFGSVRGGNYEVILMNADGSEQTNLTNNPGSDEWPDWGP
jgi:TolB protein